MDPKGLVVNSHLWLVVLLWAKARPGSPDVKGVELQPLQKMIE